MTDWKIDFFIGHIFRSIFLLFILHYIFDLFWNRVRQPCPSVALLLTSLRAQLQSWPQRTWAAQTRPGENRWLKVMSSMKARVVTSTPMIVRALIVDIQIIPECFFTKHAILMMDFFCPKAIKNPRENTRSPRTGHELKRTYEMIEGPMVRAHPGREGAPYEGTLCVLISVQYVSWFVSYQESDGTCMFLRSD